MDWGTILDNSISQMIRPLTAVFALAAIGLNVHFGYTGLLNFGQVAFMAVGGYGVAISVLEFGVPLWVGVLIGVALFIQKNRMGKAMRAVSDNRDLAESSGIDVDRVINFVWAAGAGLAALGGILHGLSQEVTWQMGFQLLLLMFAGVVLGGLGSAYGALVGSLVVGVAVEVSTLWIPSEFKTVVALSILVLILLVRPQGILGQAERVG